MMHGSFYKIIVKKDLHIRYFCLPFLNKTEHVINDLCDGLFWHIPFQFQCLEGLQWLAVGRIEFLKNITTHKLNVTLCQLNPFNIINMVA